MKKVLSLLLTSCLALGAYAQSVPFALFNATPMLVDPAYTGNMNGDLRANVSMRNVWGSVMLPATYMYTSVDGRTKYFENGDHIGIGGSFFHSSAGDDNLRSFAGVGSVAYHMSIGQHKKRPGTLSVGVQGGYWQHSIYTTIYIFDTMSNLRSMQKKVVTDLGIFNIGAAFSQKVSDRVNYILGVNVNNIVQPTNTISRNDVSDEGFGRQLTASAGVNISVSDRFSLRPAVIYFVNNGGGTVFAGNEFSLKLGKKVADTRAFMGLWYRSGEDVVYTAGITVHSFRVAASYGYNISSLNSASNGVGSVELSASYMFSSKATCKRPAIVCDRF